MKEYRKQVFTAFVIVLLLFTTSILLISYYFTHLDTKTIRNQYSQANYLEFRFLSDDMIHISNILPISDELGKKITKKEVEEGIQNIIDFEITNTSSSDSNFEVFLTKQFSNCSSIKDHYIKFYLTDQNDVPFDKFNRSEIPTFNDLYSIVDKPESKLLYKGNIYANSKQKFRLRAWLSDSYGVSNDLEEITINVGVREKKENNKYGY